MTNTCDGCKYAIWRRTATGRLHPDKSGRCSYEIKPVVLPAAFYWIGGVPRPAGGRIERGFAHRGTCQVREELPND